MFNCNNINLLTFTYYLKITLAILMTIIPFILIERTFIKLIKYKINYKKIDKLIIKKSSKTLFYALTSFILAFTIHTTLNNNNNKCYIYANKEIIKEYKSTYKLLKDEEIDNSVKTKYLENILVVSYNNLNNKEENSSVISLNNEEEIEEEVEEEVKEDNFLSETDLNKQNKVYVQDGIFYIPTYVSGVYSSYSGTSCPSNPLNEGYNNQYGYNNYFYLRLTKLIEDANNNGYKITYSSQGCRSYDTQAYYYNTMVKGRAAYPGYSRHGYGIASDLEFYQNDGSVCGYGRTDSSCPSMGWAHQNAYKYGLTFPLLNASYKEDWHIEPINIVSY